MERVDPEKIVAIVVTQKADSPSNVLPPDAETRAIAGHLNEFLAHEVKAGRLSPALQPLQAGIGTIANAVLHGMLDSPFHDLRMYSEVLQDSTIELIDAGRLSFASASSITLSKDTYERVLGDIERRMHERAEPRVRDIPLAASPVDKINSGSRAKPHAYTAPLA